MKYWLALPNLPGYWHQIFERYFWKQVQKQNCIFCYFSQKSGYTRLNKGHTTFESVKSLKVCCFRGQRFPRLAKSTKLHTASVCTCTRGIHGLLPVPLLYFFCTVLKLTGFSFKIKQERGVHSSVSILFLILNFPWKYIHLTLAKARANQFRGRFRQCRLGPHVLGVLIAHP